MKDWIRERIAASALAAASAIVFLEFFVPGVFDFIFDMMLLGLIAIVGYVQKGRA